MEDFGLPGQGKIFINSSLSYYKMLWSKSKKLLIFRKINSFYISNGTIRIKISANSSPLSITHVDDFEEHFMTLNSHHPDQAKQYKSLRSCYCC